MKFPVLPDFVPFGAAAQKLDKGYVIKKQGRIHSGWAGALFEVSGAFGQEQLGQKKTQTPKT